MNGETLRRELSIRSVGGESVLGVIVEGEPFDEMDRWLDATLTVSEFAFEAHVEHASFLLSDLAQVADSLADLMSRRAGQADMSFTEPWLSLSLEWAGNLVKLHATVQPSLSGALRIVTDLEVAPEQLATFSDRLQGAIIAFCPRLPPGDGD